MKREVISVCPVEGGWAVYASFSGLPLLFLSGAAAKAEARSLAMRVAACGQPTRVEVHDRQDAVIVRLQYCGATV